MSYLEALAERLRRGERTLENDLERVRNALRALEGRDESEAPVSLEEVPRPSPTVVRLPSAPRWTEDRREAAADDVLALVVTGVTSSKELRLQLDADHSSVLRRLYDLRREGMVEQVRGGWYPTDAARTLDWTLFRAREIGRRLESTEDGTGG